MRPDQRPAAPGGAGQASGGDFVNAEGLVVCGKCGTPKQMLVEWDDTPAVLPILCECQAAEENMREAFQRKLAHVRSVEAAPSHRLCLPPEPKHEFGLGRDDKRGFRLVRECARHWDEMEAGGLGLAFIGPPGSGKTFAANCLANYLRHDGKVALVTSVSRAESVLWDAKGYERTRVLEGLRAYDLIVIDDLGAERDTSYMDSRVFDLVDACYRSGKPLVVTTNIPLSQLKDPKGLARTRIYDRVLERCQPVIFEGPSFRAIRAEENREAVRRILRDAD